jgi:quinol monooxygenase YgiN
MNAVTPIVVVARWQMPPDAVSEVLRHVGEVREATLAEPGCLGYEVFQGTAQHCELLLLEHYRDDAALQAHRESAHYRAWVVDRILPLLTRRQVEILRPHAVA